MNSLVLIKSCQKNKDRQAACEATWVPAIRKAGVDIVFVEGEHHLTSERVSNTICLPCDDSYMGNISKLRYALYFLTRYKEFTHIFICDDDTFVHSARWLAHRPFGEFECLMTDEVPWCHGGGGWWMSRNCCMMYIECAKGHGSWDDKTASEIVQGHLVPITIRADLYSQWPTDRVSPSNKLITCHKVEPEEMHQLWMLNK